jgi:hypothetical protein
MELLELLCLIPNLIEFLYLVWRGLWWLVKGVVALLGLGARGCLWLVARLRDRVRRRDFPTATLVVDRHADRGTGAGLVSSAP